MYATAENRWTRGSASRNLRDAAKGALMRAAVSTQPL